MGVPVAFTVEKYKYTNYTNLIMSFTFKIHARNLPVMDKGMEGGSADPYFKLYVDGDKIYESDHIKHTLNPEWEVLELDRDKFGGMPKLTDIKMVVKDHDWGNSDDKMGTVYFKIHEHEGPWESRQPLMLKNNDDEDEGEIYIHIDEN